MGVRATVCVFFGDEDEVWGVVADVELGGVSPVNVGALVGMTSKEGDVAKALVLLSLESNAR
jgi:hypothetical protein